MGLGTILHVEIENIRLKYKNSRIVFNFLIKLSHGNLRRCSICFILRAFIQNLRRNIIEFLELYHNLSEIFILWQVTFLSLLSMGKSKAVKWIRNLKYSKLAHSKCKLLHDNWYEIKKKVNKLPSLKYCSKFISMKQNVLIFHHARQDSFCKPMFEKKDYWTSLG